MMDDLISRQAAIDALEEPRKVSDTWTDEYAVGERMQWEKDVKALNSLPTAQPEIVRCKDCKYFHENVFGEEIGIGAPYDILIVGHCGCSRLAGDKDMIYMESDGFCSLGERREEDVPIIST